MAAFSMQAVTQFQNWPASVYVLLLSGLVTLIASLAWRPSLPKTAPSLIPEGYPILGMLRFFSRRADFYFDGIRGASTGNFSFFFGKHPIVGVSGLDGRKTFFESKDLNMAEGYAVLFATTPRPPRPTDDSAHGSSDFSKFFSKRITAMMRKENFVRNLPILVSDTRRRLDAAAARSPTPYEGVLDPFDDVYRIVYQLTMRTVGADDIAEDPALLEKTLRLFETIEACPSPTRIIFPWLPTPAHLLRTAAGARLLMVFNKIAKARAKTGARREDPLQFLLDSGDDIVRILSFVVGALFAGQLNSGINAAYMFCYLAADREWYARVRAEVDGVVARHRTRPDQHPAEVLGGLAIEAWEGEFPLVELCLRECIRFQLVGTAFRRNISGKAVPIGGSGEVVPPDAFAVYMLDEVHFDPEVYTDPTRWDPGRYLPDRAEDKKAPLGFLGWGIGRHPCLGMRFAKLEMSIIAAMFISMFDYELVDVAGEKMDQVPMVDRNNLAASKPKVPMRLKYRVREHWT